MSNSQAYSITTREGVLSGRNASGNTKGSSTDALSIEDSDGRAGLMLGYADASARAFAIRSTINRTLIFTDLGTYGVSDAAGDLVTVSTSQFIVNASRGILSPNGINLESGSMTSSGNVGIGTTSPGDKLHVSSPTVAVIIDGVNAGGGLVINGRTDIDNSTATIRLGNQNTLMCQTVGTNCGIGNIEFYSNDASAGARGVRASINAVADINSATPNSGPAQIEFKTADAGVSTTTAMVINSKQRVGIGTGNPEQALTVQGRVLSTGTGGGTDYIHFIASNTHTATNVAAVYGAKGGGASAFYGGIGFLGDGRGFIANKNTSLNDLASNGFGQALLTWSAGQNATFRNGVLASSATISGNIIGQSSITTSGGLFGTDLKLGTQNGSTANNLFMYERFITSGTATRAGQVCLYQNGSSSSRRNWCMVGENSNQGAVDFITSDTPVGDPNTSNVALSLKRDLTAVFGSTVNVGVASLHATTITASGYLIPSSWTLAQIRAATPQASEVWGLVICTNCASAGSVCQSTGTTINGFRLGTTGTTECK
jgi:hypothetical protein